MAIKVTFSAIGIISVMFFVRFLLALRRDERWNAFVVIPAGLGHLLRFRPLAVSGIPPDEPARQSRTAAGRN